MPHCNVTVHDNVLTKSTFNLLKNEIVESMVFPWFRTVTTSYDNPNIELHDFSWTHIVLRNGQPESQIYSLLQPLLLSVFDNINEPVEQFLRIRLALQTPVGSMYVNTPHVDDPNPHKTAIIYLNDSDGDTLIYNEKFDPTSGHSITDYKNKVLKNNFTLMNSIKPKANTMCLFDGFHYHSSQKPITHPLRVICNINYI